MGGLGHGLGERAGIYLGPRTKVSTDWDGDLGIACMSLGYHVVGLR
jgi:hypothetical protein